MSYSTNVCTDSPNVNSFVHYIDRLDCEKPDQSVASLHTELLLLEQYSIVRICFANVTEACNGILLLETLNGILTDGYTISFDILCIMFGYL